MVSDGLLEHCYGHRNTPGTLLDDSWMSLGHPKIDQKNVDFDPDFDTKMLRYMAFVDGFG